jgi:pimeloyl-ACP methyl ester carboxylesterase
MHRVALAIALILFVQAAGAAGVTRGVVRANGVRLSYAAWGGQGEPLLLLAGLGDDAGIFDSFAPRFTDRFRVWALTRRGFGQSEKPIGGYDISTRVEDIRAFLDVLKIRRVHLMGHSAAGDEMTVFAARYPDRMLKLVYLDAAYNRYHLMAMLSSDPAAPPWFKSIGAEGATDKSARVPRDVPPPVADREVWRAFVSCMRSGNEFRPDYRNIQAPALAIYAVSQSHPLAASVTDAAKRKAMNGWWAANGGARMRSSIAQFRREVRRGQVVELAGANHHLFLGATQERVVASTRTFLLGSDR